MGIGLGVRRKGRLETIEPGEWVEVCRKGERFWCRVENAYPLGGLLVSINDERLASDRGIDSTHCCHRRQWVRPATPTRAGRRSWPMLSAGSLQRWLVAPASYLE